MRAFNDITGTVHEAKTDGTGLVQICGIQANQTLYLTETTEAVTCKRCQRMGAPKPTKTAPARVAKESSGPVTWGIFSPGGALQCDRPTRKAALAAAEHLGEGHTVAKL
jgi:hypothetical protein